MRYNSPIVLEAANINVGDRVKDASLVLRRSEIVGLAGMVGSGRTELAMAIFGGIPMSSGSVTVGGQNLRPNIVRHFDS